MKKLSIMIIILAIIFVGMIVYQKLGKSTANIEIQEVKKIENYIHQIYMWKEITGQALPSFEEINQADETWVWQVVEKNLEDYQFSYSQIQNKTKELFGENFKKEFPKEGTQYLIYDEQNNLYYAVQIDLDQQEDEFLLNKIDKIKNGYEVEILEYIEDYTQTANSSSNYIIIRNLEGQEIGKVTTEEEEQAKEIVKENSDKLTKKKIILKKENEKIVVEKVIQE